MKRLPLLAIGITVLLGTSALADAPTKTTTNAKTVKAIKPTEMTCQKFLSYDEVTRPQIVYWSEGMNGKGKPEDTVIDVDRINTHVPILVEDCTKEPKSSYWQKMKLEFKKLF